MSGLQMTDKFGTVVEDVALMADNQIAEALTSLTDEISDAVESAIDDAVHSISRDVASQVREMLEERFDGHRKFTVNELVKTELERRREELTAPSGNSDGVEKITELESYIEDLKHSVVMLEALILKATDPSLGFFETAQKLGELRNVVQFRIKEREDIKTNLV
jgi:hypothetical protein